MEKSFHVPHIPEKDFRIAFIGSLVLKGANAIVQIILGSVLLCAGNLSGIVYHLAQTELLEDPGDFIATHISRLTAHITTQGQLFAAIYLLSHGLIKLFLVWSLIKNKLWAYPASISVFILFMIYQIVATINSFSVFFLILTIFDGLVIWLIWHEYRYVLKKRHVPIA